MSLEDRLKEFGATERGSRINKWLLPKLDRLMLKLTGGKRTFTSLTIPTLVLTHVGRKSGTEYRTPLCFVRDGDRVAVVGTNWGGEDHPSWSSNLLANPETTIVLDEQTIPVRARRVEGGEADRLYAKFEELAPTYRSYCERIGARDIRVFVLEPRAAASTTANAS